MQQNKEELVKFLQEDLSLVYLDIFNRLNELNFSLQGHDKTVINFIDIFSAFQPKLQPWERKLTIGRTGMFPTLNEFLKDTEDVRLDDSVKSKIINNLHSLRCELPSISPTSQEMIWHLLETRIWSQAQTLSAYLMEMMIFKRSL